MKLVTPAGFGALLFALTILASPCTAQAAAAPDDKGLADRVKQLEGYVQVLQKTTIAAQLRELDRIANMAKIAPEEKKKVHKAVVDACTAVEKGNISFDIIDPVIEAFVHAFGEPQIKSTKDGDDVKKCLDDCRQHYNEAKAECNKISDGIGRANCLTRALNQWTNCTNGCNAMAAEH